ncbi:MAG: serine protease [Lentisphaerae bacterium]|nr:MAG: serine protease [Lentisphaerota bacterium]
MLSLGQLFPRDKAPTLVAANGAAAIETIGIQALASRRYVRKGYGVLSPDGRSVYTCAHVLAGSSHMDTGEAPLPFIPAVSKVKILGTGQILPIDAGAWHMIPARDLAVCRLPHPVQLIAYRPIAPESLSPGQKLMVGQALLTPRISATLRRTVKNLDKPLLYEIELSQPVRPGMSGMPVWTRDRQLLGIVKAALPQREKSGTWRAWVIPVDPLLTEKTEENKPTGAASSPLFLQITDTPHRTQEMPTPTHSSMVIPQKIPQLRLWQPLNGLWESPVRGELRQLLPTPATPLPYQIFSDPKRAVQALAMTIIPPPASQHPLSFGVIFGMHRSRGAVALLFRRGPQTIRYSYTLQWLQCSPPWARGSIIEEKILPPGYTPPFHLTINLRNSKLCIDLAGKTLLSTRLPSLLPGAIGCLTTGPVRFTDIRVAETPPRSETSRISPENMLRLRELSFEETFFPPTPHIPISWKIVSEEQVKPQYFTGQGLYIPPQSAILLKLDSLSFQTARFRYRISFREDTTAPLEIRLHRPGEKLILQCLPRRDHLLLEIQHFNNEKLLSRSSPRIVKTLRAKDHSASDPAIYSAELSFHLRQASLSCSDGASSSVFPLTHRSAGQWQLSLGTAKGPWFITGLRIHCRPY